jgi:hypothetical protein
MTTNIPPITITPSPRQSSISVSQPSTPSPQATTPTPEALLAILTNVRIHLSSHASNFTSLILTQKKKEKQIQDSHLDPLLIQSLTTYPFQRAQLINLSNRLKTVYDKLIDLYLDDDIVVPAARVENMIRDIEERAGEKEAEGLVEAVGILEKQVRILQRRGRGVKEGTTGPDSSPARIR